MTNPSLPWRYTWRGEPVFKLRAKEYRLAAVGVRYPAIEYQHRAKLLGIGNLAEQRVGDEIVDGHGFRIAGMPRSEVPARLHFEAACAGLHVHLADCFRGTHARCGCIRYSRRGDLQMVENLAGDHFIDQDATMLRVILELDDVKVAVVGFQQVRLGAAPHFPDEPARIYGHAKRPVGRGHTERTERKNDTRGNEDQRPRPRRRVQPRAGMKWRWN